MVGWAPDASKLPDGWPTELPLPRGGALVVGSENAAFGFFLSFLFFMLNIINMPLQPVFRMLTSKEEQPIDEADGVEAGTPAVDDASGLAAVAADSVTAVPVLVGDGAQAPVAPAAVSSSESGAPAAGEPGVIV